MGYILPSGYNSMETQIKYKIKKWPVGGSAVKYFHMKQYEQYFVRGKNGCVENLQKSTIYRKSVTVHQNHGSTGHVGEAGVC